MAMFMMKPVRRPMSLQRKNGYTFIHPFDDPAVATDREPLPMEIIKELPVVDIYLSTGWRGGLATVFPRWRSS